MANKQHKQTKPADPAPAQVADEEVHVPRGQSRLRFLLILGLLIFLLIIFVVPSEFQNLFSGAAPVDAAYMTWTHPSSGPQQVSNRDFVYARRRYDNFFRLINAGREGRTLLDSDEQLARLLIVDQLARDAGIEVTDKEIKNSVRDGGFLMLGKSKDLSPGMNSGYFFFPLPPFSDSATYTQSLRNAGLSANEYQETLRSVLRIQRYEALLQIVAQPDPASLEAVWKERHQEHSFDVVAFDVSAATATAAEQLPDDAGLTKWYEELEPNLKRSLFLAQWTTERASAELFVWQPSQGTPEALLAKYPRPDGTDPEQLAKDYYARFAPLRFRRAEDKADAANDYDRQYKSFDEVADSARLESQIHAAVVDLQAAIQARFKAGEIVDLQAEALAAGLQYVKVDAPRSRQEWTDDPELGDRNLGEQVLRAARTDKFVPLVVGAERFVFGRALEHDDAGPPPFEQVREECVTQWKSQKGLENAKAQAQALADTFKPDPASAPAPGVVMPPKADAAAFEAAALAAGVQVLSTGWLDQTDLPQELGAEPSDAQRFALELSRAARAALGSELDVLTGPLTDAAKTRVFVARHAGKRDPETVAIEPKEYADVERSSVNKRYIDLRENLIEPPGLEKKFGLAFPGRKASETEEPLPKG